MAALQICLLIVYAIGIALGQLLFKLASMRAFSGNSSFTDFFALALNPWFVSAVFLYGGLSVLWIWLLKQVPLSSAYPFVALSFVLTLVFSAVLLDERMAARQLIGAGLIVGGILMVAS
ncbi:MAG: hypothetical protein RIS94_101 [Pseudomonadota bacterium]